MSDSFLVFSNSDLRTLNKREGSARCSEKMNWSELAASSSTALSHDVGKWKSPSLAFFSGFESRPLLTSCCAKNRLYNLGMSSGVKGFRA